METLAIKDLKRFLFTCVLEGQNNISRLSEQLKKKNWYKIMCETKRCTQWIESSKLKASEHRTLTSGASATVEMDVILGKENDAIIAQSLDELRKL